MRLIDANALIKEANADGAYGYVDAKQIADAPTVDAVPVTRCKDCRLGEPDMIFNGYKDDFWCKYYEHPKPADGFCEKGKMRTNENEPLGT